MASGKNRLCALGVHVLAALANVVANGGLPKVGAIPARTGPRTHLMTWTFLRREPSCAALPTYV
jgi:hypothetical protein